MTISKLLALDVSKHVEKKNNLSYLSWAHAWAEALKADPLATFHVETFQRADATTVPYMEINGYAMVWVRVTIFGKEMTCFLPVMNSKNDPIKIAGRKYKDKYGNEKIEEIDSFNVNTAIMRCMAKALALHGLGLNIYAGEDLPMAEEEEEPKKEEPKKTKKAEKPEAKTMQEFVTDGAALVAALGADDAPLTEAKVLAAISTVDRANAELFAQGMVDFVIICKTYDGLRSYWKANQEKVDDLKSNHPDLFERVRDVFGEMKAKFLKIESKENASE
jgi:hypothetical protein